MRRRDWVAEDIVPTRLRLGNHRLEGLEVDPPGVAEWRGLRVFPDPRLPNPDVMISDAGAPLVGPGPAGVVDDVEDGKIHRSKLQERVKSRRDETRVQARTFPNLLLQLSALFGAPLV